MPNKISSLISKNGGKFERRKHRHSNEQAKCLGKLKKVKQSTEIKILSYCDILRRKIKETRSIIRDLKVRLVGEPIFSREKSAKIWVLLTQI